MSSNGVRRLEKLRKGVEFRCVFDAAARSTDAYFTVLARSNGRDGPRLGIAVGRKRLRRAVDRNRFKRLIRESFRQHSGRLQGMDVVVMVRCGAATENRQIFGSLDLHWRKLERERELGHVPAAAIS